MDNQFNNWNYNISIIQNISYLVASIKELAIGMFASRNQACTRTFIKDEANQGLGDSSGAVWESRWPSWAVRPNEPSGFRGRKAILNHASALVSACP